MVARPRRPALEDRLRAATNGDVAFDRFSRGRYATDASFYQMMPIGVLAPRDVADVEAALAIAREEGMTLLVVEQNANLALDIGHRGYVLETGQIVAEGPAEQLRSDDTIRKAYLGF